MTMKKVFATVQIMIFLFALLPGIGAAASGSTLVLDWDLSAYDGQSNTIITNRVVNTDITLEATTGTGGTLPAVDSFTTMNGTNTRYLIFGEDDGGDSFIAGTKDRAVRVYGTDFINQGAGTVSFWMRTDPSDSDVSRTNFWTGVSSKGERLYKNILSYRN